MTTPNIPGWARLEACPITPGCVAKVVYRDADGNLFRLNPRNGDFTPHKCHVRGSERPSRVYAGKWRNKRTDRIRWNGPKRLRASAEKPPSDENTRPEDWEYIETYFADLKWKLITD